MKFLIPSLVASLFCVTPSVLAKPASEDGAANKKRVIIKFRNDAGKSEAYNCDGGGQNFCSSFDGRYHVVCKSLPQEAIDALKTNPNIESVTDDVGIHAAGWSENNEAIVESAAKQLRGMNDADRQLFQAIGYAGIRTQYNQVPQAIGPGSGKTRVCVADSGYGLGHPDLPSSGYVDGSDLSNSNRWDEDEASHGTPVSSIIAALDNNDCALGVNPTAAGGNFEFFMARCLDNQISAFASDAVEAVQSCLDSKQPDENLVINMSFQFDSEPQSSSFRQIFTDFYDNENVLLIAAAGNGGDFETSMAYPAYYPGVMSVAAAGGNNAIAPFSLRNDQIEISAPGISIRGATTIDGGFGCGDNSGTSFASPYVAGIAAKVWSHFPQCNNKQIRQALRESAQLRNGATSCDSEQGNGHVNAVQVYNFLLERTSNGGCDVPEYIGPGGCFGGVNVLSTPPPTLPPSPLPTSPPSVPPSPAPTGEPTKTPTSLPTSPPSVPPSPSPTSEPTQDPTSLPTSPPSVPPTTSPTPSPTVILFSTPPPTEAPTPFPSSSPTSNPTPIPTAPPIPEEILISTLPPTEAPTPIPSNPPTTNPTASPTNPPSTTPSYSPTAPPTAMPTKDPTPQPSTPPTSQPTMAPTTSPTHAPTPAQTETCLERRARCSDSNECCDGLECRKNRCRRQKESKSRRRLIVRGNFEDDIWSSSDE